MGKSASGMLVVFGFFLMSRKKKKITKNTKSNPFDGNWDNLMQKNSWKYIYKFKNLKISNNYYKVCNLIVTNTYKYIYTNKNK